MTAGAVSLPTAAAIVEATAVLNRALAAAQRWLENADDLLPSVKNALGAAFGAQESVVGSTIRRAEAAVTGLQDGIVSGRALWNAVTTPPEDVATDPEGLEALKALERADQERIRAITEASDLHSALVKGERMLPVATAKAKDVVLVVLESWDAWCQDRDAEGERQIAALKVEQERRRKVFAAEKQRYAG